MAHQVSGLVLLSLIVFGVISGLIIRVEYGESLRRDLIAKGESIARGLSISSRCETCHGPGGSVARGPAIDDEQGLLWEDSKHMPLVLGEFSKIQGVAYIAVLNREGEVVAQSQAGTMPPAVVGPHAQREGIQEYPLQGSHGLIDIAAPIEKGPMGSVHVGMDQGVVARSLEDVPLLVWRIVLVSVLCAMSVAVIVYFRTIRPINLLGGFIRQIGHGDFSGTVPVPSGGEIGVLARSLQQMSADLKRYHDQLETKTRELQTSKEELERQNEEFKRAQAHMIRSEKFAAMGQLAATVAHEISNPLAGILTYLKLIRRKMEAGEGLQEQRDRYLQYLVTMEKETERCGHIVKNLLDFARSSEPDLREIDIHRVIDDTLFLITHKLLMSDVGLEKSYEDVPRVLGDFGQLKQVFLNVILNAVEAMRGEERRLTIHTHFHRETHTVLVEIEDSGEGISEKNIYKVFDPFFTTKPRGTGMGLAVVFGILEKHNADISIDSQPGKGTKVTIQLNASRSEARRTVDETVSGA
jgi:signal transduction histidine kinase